MDFETLIKLLNEWEDFQEWANLRGGDISPPQAVVDIKEESIDENGAIIYHIEIRFVPPSYNFPVEPGRYHYYPMPSIYQKYFSEIVKKILIKTLTPSNLIKEYKDTIRKYTKRFEATLKDILKEKETKEGRNE